MIRLRESKLFYFTATLLLIGFAALAFHFVAHSIQHDAGDKDDAGQCPICQFVARIAFILLCILLLILRLEQNVFVVSTQSKATSFRLFLPHQGRAPPLFF